MTIIQETEPIFVKLEGKYYSIVPQVDNVGKLVYADGRNN